jgi:hypothetical protein
MVMAWEGGPGNRQGVGSRHGEAAGHGRCTRSRATGEPPELRKHPEVAAAVVAKDLQNLNAKFSCGF